MNFARRPTVQLLSRLALLLPVLAHAAALAATPAKPNIILIYSDDHGFADLGAQGVDQDIRTPHLDALARDGVRFPRGCVTSAVTAPPCSSRRATARASAAIWASSTPRRCPGRPR